MEFESIRPYKLLLVIDGFGSGGAQRQMINLSAGLLESQVGHKLLGLNEINDYRQLLDKYGIKPDLIKHKNPIFKLFKLFFYVKRERPSHIIVFLFYPTFYTLITSLFFPSIKIVVSERSFEGALAPFHRHVTRRLYWRAAYIVANSQGQTDILSKKYNRVKYIPNGVANEAYFQRESYKRRGVIVGIGRVSRLKNPELLINALSIYNRSNSIPFKVIWIGDTKEYEDYYRFCNQLLAEKQLEDVWTWVGKTQEVEKYIDMAHFLYHGSFGEGFPNVICEAMAREVPVIASDVCDHSSVIADGENGYLFDPNNLQELVNKIEALAGLTDKHYQEMSKLAGRTISSKFSMTSFVNSYRELVRE